MENKIYVLKVLYNIRNQIDNKRLALEIRKYWPEIKNPWNNEYITTKQLVILFRMADKEIMMDRKFEGTVDIFRHSDAFTGKFGKSYCTKMESLIQYQKDFETSNCLCTKTKAERIIAYFADRDEAIVDVPGEFYDIETGLSYSEEVY